jgi:hypothetical protein
MQDAAVVDSQHEYGELAQWCVDVEATSSLAEVAEHAVTSV